MGRPGPAVRAGPNCVASLHRIDSRGSESNLWDPEVA
jgi:hypothetical protein